MRLLVSDKLSELKSLIRSFESCVVAYSGGVDSVFLAVVANEVLGERAVAVIADSPSLPRRELADAEAIAARFGFRLQVVRTREFANESYTSNPVNRCYFCKSELFQVLRPFAEEHRLKVLAYGENASDLGDYRPGRVAADEFEVRAPLREVGLSKDEIRRLSRELGLPTAEKPAQPCLSSRIPYGEVVSREKLGLIERGEAFIHDLGYPDVRLRLHEVKQGVLGRIELPVADLEPFFSAGHATETEQALKAMGLQHVTVDLVGYRRGSLNQGVVDASGGTAGPMGAGGGQHE